MLIRGKERGRSSRTGTVYSCTRGTMRLCADSRHGELTEYREKDVVTRLFSKFTRVASAFVFLNALFVGCGKMWNTNVWESSRFNLVTFSWIIFSRRVIFLCLSLSVFFSLLNTWVIFGLLKFRLVFLFLSLFYF